MTGQIAPRPLAGGAGNSTPNGSRSEPVSGCPPAVLLSPLDPGREFPCLMAQKMPDRLEFPVADLAELRHAAGRQCAVMDDRPERLRR